MIFLTSQRGPFTEKLRTSEYATSKAINKGKTLPVSAKDTVRSAGEATKAVLQSPGFNAMLRVLGRTAEAGGEGTALHLLARQRSSRCSCGLGRGAVCGQLAPRP